MEKVVHTDYVDFPDHPGAYWMFDEDMKIYLICNVIFHEKEFFIQFPGREGGMPVKKMPSRWTFWGPISLPTGTARISANAVYEEIGEPVEPKKE